MSPINITMETYMQVLQKNVKIQQLFIDLYVGTIMDVKKNQLLYLYVNIAMHVKKTNNCLRDLYASITMDVKESTIIYKTYMWVLHI